MYAVNFTWFEKHSRFSLRPAERATHDNQLCFFKDWQCICPSPLQYTIYYGKSAVFSPCSYTSPSSISDWSCETQKKSNCINPLRWRAFCLRNMDERLSPVHVRCDRSNELRKNRVCCKAYPACEANDDTYTAKNRLMLRQRRTVPTCHWLQNGVSIIKYATSPTISKLEIHHRR